MSDGGLRWRRSTSRDVRTSRGKSRVGQHLKTYENIEKAVKGGTAPEGIYGNPGGSQGWDSTRRDTRTSRGQSRVGQHPKGYEDIQGAVKGGAAPEGI